jgi:hypothetical protein
MNSVRSSLKASSPGYKGAGEKRGLRLEEWILPAFSIPIRNPAVTNKGGGLESGPGSRSSKEISSTHLEMIQIFLF